MEKFTDWLARYFQAWKSNEATEVTELFAENAVYHYGPYSEPSIGRERIVAAWIANPGQQRNIRTFFEPLAVTGPIGIAHWRVIFDTAEKPALQIELDGILVITFDEYGRCLEHKEWYQSRESLASPK